MALVDDVFPEILERVDPSFIFDCINVCKGWLEVITSPEFRKRYQKRWKTNSKLVGFMMGYEHKLSTCSKLGRIMGGNMSSQLPYDHFISKSGDGDGLIFYGSFLHQRLYVSKADEMRPIQLPPPPNMLLFNHRATTGMAILSQGNSSYKVIILLTMYDKVTIRTFSSSTNEWEKSEVTLPLVPPLP